MKLGFVAHGVGTQGGIESVVYHLSRQCARLGHEVTVFAQRFPVEGMPEIKCVEVKVPRLPWALHQFYFAWASAKAVRQHPQPVDVLQAHVNTFAQAQISVCHSVHVVGSKLVASLDPNPVRRSWLWVKSLAPVISWLAGVNYRRPGMVVTVATSTGIGRELASLYPVVKGKTVYIPNGYVPSFRKPAPAGTRLQLRKKMGLKADDRALLFIGKEFHRKGLESILRALPLLPKRVILWVIGNNVDNVPTRFYQDLVRELKIGERVKFWGHQVDLLKFYQAADAFVFPTLYEAFAMVSIESMACGLPLLACKVNGTEDLIENGKNGAFIERDGHSIASAVEKWILPERKRQSLSRGALGTARAYTWEKIAKKYISVCSAVLKNRTIPGLLEISR